MSLQAISNTDLLTRMTKLVRTERKITHLVLQHIVEIEDRKLYAEIGFASMFAYLTRELGYSESCAYTRLQSARLLRKVPEIAEQIEEGALNLTQLTQVQKCLKSQVQNSVSLTKTETLAVLEKIENKNGFNTKKVLATEFDLPLEQYETLKPQKDNSVRVEITFTEEQYAEIEQVKSLLSHICPSGSLADVFTYLAKSYCTKKLKPKKASGSSKLISQAPDLRLNKIAEKTNDFESSKSEFSIPKDDNTGSNSITQRFAAKKVPRKYISVHTHRNLLERAQFHCEYKDPLTGRRCDSNHQLEKDHIQPWALGGSDRIENLQILCRTHNDLRARKFGWKFEKTI